MYKKTDIINKIISKIPEFREVHKSHLEWWGEDPPPIGCEIAYFSRFLKEYIFTQKPDKKLLNRCFQVIEDLLANGDSDVKEYIYAEFIENITNEFPEGFAEPDVRQYMLARTSKGLDYVNNFWGT